MPTATYTPLQTLTLGSNQATVTFANIPNTYKDLILILNTEQAGGTSGNGSIMRVNGDSGTNYSNVLMTGNGSSTSSSSQTSANAFNDLYFFEGVRGTHIIQFLDYSATDKHKTVLARANVANFLLRAGAGRWASSAAINSIFLQPIAGRTFASGSTFSLYGIAG